MISTNFIIYKKATGMITQLGSCPPEMVDLQLVHPDTDGLINTGEEEVNSRTKFVRNGNLVDKTESPAVIDKASISANGLDVAAITGLTNPTIVFINGAPYVTITDGTFEFTTDLAGTYVFKLQSVPYLDKEITLYAY